MAGEPRGALFAPGKLPAELERKRRRHGASCPGGKGSAAGWRFRVFFEDSRDAAPGPAKNRQVQQGREQSGPERPICISCPQTRRNNNHGCRVRKRRGQHRWRAGICNKEIGRGERRTGHPAFEDGPTSAGCRCHGRMLFEAVFFHAGRRRSEFFHQVGQTRIFFEHGGFHGFAHGPAGFTAGPG